MLNMFTQSEELFVFSFSQLIISNHVFLQLEIVNYDFKS